MPIRDNLSGTGRLTDFGPACSIVSDLPVREIDGLIIFYIIAKGTWFVQGYCNRNM